MLFGAPTIRLLLIKTLDLDFLSFASSSSSSSMEIYQEFVLVSVLSLLLAFLIGKLFSFSDDDADRRLDPEPTNVGGETRRDDSPRRRLIGDRCEESSEFEEVRSDDDGICHLDEDDKGQGEASDVRVDDFGDDLETRFEMIGVDDCCASEMCDGKKIAFVEERKFESNEGEAMLISGASEVRVDEKERFERAVVEDMYKLKDDKFVLGKGGDVKVGNEENVDEFTEERTAPKEVTECETEADKRVGGEEGDSLSEDDEWEGIEQTELQMRFYEAATYVGGEKGASALSSLSTEEQMQLYGLHKVATEGPCYDPQPMALKVTARGKWNAWQRLGNMNPDVAMEEYMSLLSEKIPGWMVEKPEGHVEPHARSEVLDAPSSETPLPKLCFDINSQLSTETKRGEECPSCIGTVIPSAAVGHTSQGRAL